MSNKKYTLQEVKSAADKQAWLDFPKKGLYKAYPNWVCPLDTDVEKVFDPKRNELLHDEQNNQKKPTTAISQLLTLFKREEDQQ